MLLKREIHSFNVSKLLWTELSSNFTTRGWVLSSNFFLILHGVGNMAHHHLASQKKLQKNCESGEKGIILPEKG